MIHWSKEKDLMETIGQCPLSFIDTFAELSYTRYSEMKLKKELGIVTGEVSKLNFEAFKVIASSEANQQMYDIEKTKEKGKINEPRRKP